MHNCSSETLPLLCVKDAAAVYWSGVDRRHRRVQEVAHQSNHCVAFFFLLATVRVSWVLTEVVSIARY